MESQRTLLTIGLVLVSVLLFQQWTTDHQQAQQPTPVVATSAAPTNNQDAMPTADDTSSLPAAVTVSQQTISVTTDLFALNIDPMGGDIVQADLVAIKEKLDSDEPFRLLGQLNDYQYFARSGLIGQDGIDSKNRARYQASQNQFTMTGDHLDVVLTHTTSDGVVVEKIYGFNRGSYAATLTIKVHNQSASAKTMQMFTDLKQSVQEKTGMLPTYRGAAYSTSEEKYEKYSFDDIKDRNLDVNTTGGWVAMLQHYFVSAWVPAQTDKQSLYSLYARGGYAYIGTKSEPVTVAANGNTEFTAQLYMGPKDQDRLVAIHHTLDLTVDYGILWFLSQFLFAVLSFIQSYVHNWGLAIILITILVKSLLYPLTKAQYVSMAKMRNLQPKMQALKDRFGDDRQKMGQAMMELYRKEQVNPMGGCLPMLIQMPIFLALYFVFLESVEFRHAPFIFWIQDLSAMDPYFVLPVLYGISMYVMQKLQPMTVTDPMQQKVMMWMPVIFSVFFIFFASGLVLYWFVSNLISIAQMLIIFKQMEKQGITSKAK